MFWHEQILRVSAYAVTTKSTVYTNIFWHFLFLCFDLQVCVFFYFIYILSYPGSKSLDTSSGQQNLDKAAENANMANSSSKTEDSKIRFTQGVEESSNQSGWKSTRESTRKSRTEFSIKPPSVELWKGLYQRHWPQLLNYYNISLLGR